jgi:hypothetical protein
MLTARQAHELMWNRTCSVRGGKGNNVPLDLKMEHFNREFKGNISRFSSSINEANIKRTSRVTKEVAAVAALFDQTVGVKPQTSISKKPDVSDDLQRIIQELEAANVFNFQPNRYHVAFKAMPRHPFTPIIKDLNKFHKWVSAKRDELTREKLFREFTQTRPLMKAIQAEHCYARL